MNLSRLALALPLLASLAAQAETPTVPSGASQPVQKPPENRNYVAVVIGISSYDNLPDEVELDFARSDAATVAKALREKAHFNEVFVLGDGQAKRDAVNELLRTKVAQIVGPNDVLVLYFAGHGIGADLDLPVLLAADSTLENGQEDGFELQKFARDLQTWDRAGTMIIATDTIHRNQLDGIYFYGPSADQWPGMPTGTMIISSSQGQQPARDGAFGQVFADGIAGAADTDRDSLITGSELFTYLVNRLSPTGQVPVAAGQFEGTMVVAAGVTPVEEPVVREDRPDNPKNVEPEPPKVIYPDYSVPKAKFVWDAGGAQTVQCREMPVTTCAPSCYVTNFKAGPCNLAAVFDGIPMKGEIVVLGPGLYSCKRVGGELKCTGP